MGWPLRPQMFVMQVRVVASLVTTTAHPVAWRDASGTGFLGEPTMLHYAVVFLVIALIAGVLGFGGIAGSAVGIAKILFFVFLVLFVVSLILGKRTSN